MTETRTTTTPEAAITVVREFLEAMAEGRTDAATALLDPDIAWHNTSLPTIRGGRRVHSILSGLTKPWLGFDVVVHHIA
ncbi:limonene-1,2-epoxide hydrolase family protein, partial [Rhodococcus chondri]